MTLAGACAPGAPTPAPVAPAAAAPKPTAPPAQAPPAATTAPPAAAANTPAPAPTAAAAAPAAAGQPKRGGVLISALTVDPVTLDPHLGFPGSPQALMYETLTYFDAQSKVQPLLAESWEVLDEGATIVFRLRKGVKFHSGREMVADDVKYSMERLQDKASVFAADYAVIQKIDIVDPYTVKMSFAKPFPGVFRMLSQFKGGEIVGKEGVQKWGDLARNGMGTGPFMLDRWTSGSEVVLKRHPDYWRKDLPYLDGMTFKIIKDEDAIVAGLRAGSIHRVEILDYSNVKRLEADANVKIYRIPRLQDGVVAMYVNARIGHLADPKVREALYWAFDRDAAVKIATAGLGIATGPISPTVTPWTLPPEEVSKWYRRDLDAARKAVEAAKATGKYPDGIKTEVWADAAVRWRQDTAQILSANAKEVGITCEVKMMDPGVLTKAFLAREAPIYPNTWGASSIDPDSMFRFMNSKAQDYPGLQDPEVDKLLEQGRYTWDYEKRKPIYDKLQRTMLERFSNIWMFHMDNYDAVRKNVRYTRDLYPPMGLKGLAETWME
jgi:peptide/nickel transport system substrate-binding protein